MLEVSSSYYGDSIGLAPIALGTFNQKKSTPKSKGKGLLKNFDR